MDNRKLSIIITDDHPIVIEGLAKVLSNAFANAEVRCYLSGANLLAHLHRHKKCDVILLDITLPDASGIDLCKQIKLLNPEIAVLAFSNHNERGTIMQMFNNGANGYILKNADTQEVIDCINKALNGDIAMSAEVTEIMAKPTLNDFKQAPVLTRREAEVLQYIADGKTGVAIAELLHVSPLTIETHRRNLMQKLEVNKVTTMLKVAAELGLI